MQIFLFLFVLLCGFASQATKCPAGHYLVRGHIRSGYIRSDGTAVRPTTVTAYCKQLTYAYEYAQKRFKKGIPKDWPHRSEKSRSWTEQEKQQVVDALEALPDFLLSDRIESLYRLRKSKDFPNPASNADGIIVIYDTAFTNAIGIERILAHELMHQTYKDLTEKERQDYRRATGWHLEIEPNGKFYWVGRKNGYIADDGKTSHEEDYANNLEYFLYDPDKLKKATPSAYEWIKKKYGNRLKLKGKK